MNDIKISDMMEMQTKLYKANEGKWSPMQPEYGKNFILWLVEELGEVISIVKKKGSKKIMEDTEVRKAFVEEMSDVLMYYNDILLRYNVSAEEISNAYVSKYENNIKRNYEKEYLEKKPN